MKPKGFGGSNPPLYAPEPIFLRTFRSTGLSAARGRLQVQKLLQLDRYRDVESLVLDHFIAGAMAMPWMFAGRRWVATRDLQLMCYPQDSALANPVTKGCYVSIYWITRGRLRDHVDWTMATNRRLAGDKRLGNNLHVVQHVYTSFQDHAGSVYRDYEGPRDFHALYYPYQGLVLEVIDAPDA